MAASPPARALASTGDSDRTFVALSAHRRRSGEVLIGRTERKLVSVVIAAGALTAPSAASANGSCARDFTANHACAIKSPAHLNGKLGTDNERDYYVFHATKGTKLRIAITDTENPGCLLSMYSDCGSVKASSSVPGSTRLRAPPTHRNSPEAPFGRASPTHSPVRGLTTSSSQEVLDSSPPRRAVGIRTYFR